MLISAEHCYIVTGDRGRRILTNNPSRCNVKCSTHSFFKNRNRNTPQHVILKTAKLLHFTAGAQRTDMFAERLEPASVSDSSPASLAKFREKKTDFFSLNILTVRYSPVTGRTQSAWRRLFGAVNSSCC